MPITQAGQTVDDMRASLAEFIASKRDADGNLKASAEEVAEIRQRHDDINKTAKEQEAVADAEKIAKGNDEALKAARGSDRMIFAAGTATDTAPKGLKAQISAASWNEYGEHLTLSADEYKAVVTLTTLSPVVPRDGQVYNPAREERSVLDLIPEGAIDGPTLSYVTLNLPTNAATTVAEGGTKPEATLAFTTVSESVKKVAVWIPATDEALQDNAGLQSLITNELMFMVRRREEQQVLNGDGTGSNLLGILNRSGIQTQAMGVDDRFTAVYKAINKVRNVAFSEPTGIILHPDDWMDIITMKDAQGRFIIGDPQNLADERLWGLPVRITTELTSGTGLVGAFRPWSQILRRSAAAVAISTEHSTFFIENKVAIRAESRLGLKVVRPAAFCTVTGI